MASEKINVVLEADARQLTTEFARAEAASKALSQKTLPLLASNLNQAWVQNNRLAAGMKASQTATRGAGQGLLQLSYFADDAQYGLRGIMNNIPGLLMGLGAGAGLAGVVSLAALSFVFLDKAIKKVTGLDNAEAFDKSMDSAAAAGRDLTDSLQKQTAQRRQAEEMETRLGRIYQTKSAALAEQLTMETQRTKELQAQEKAVSARRTIEDQLISARQSLRTGPDAEASNLAESAKIRAVRLQEDLARAYAATADANANYNRVIREGGAAITDQQNAIFSLTSELKTLEDRNNITQGRLKAAADGLKGAPTGRGTNKLRANAQANLNTLRAQDAQEQKSLAEVRKRLEDARKLLEQARTANQANRDLVTEESEARKLAVASIRDQIRASKELLEIEKQRTAAAEEARLNSDLQARRDSMAAARRRYEDSLIMRGNGTPARDIDAERRTAYQSVKAMHDRAVREAGLIPTAAGISTGYRGGSRLQGPRGLDGPRGLGPETRRRFGREDATPDLSEAQKAAAYYIKALENDEKLIKAFDRLGLL